MPLTPRPSLHSNVDGSGGDTVRNHDQAAGPGLLAGWHIELSGHNSPKRDGHAAVVVRPAVENVPGCLVSDTHQREVRGSLLVIPVGRPLRHTIEQMTGNGIRTPRTNCRGSFLDSWCPGGIVAATGIVNHDCEKVGQEDLASRKDQHVPDI